MDSKERHRTCDLLRLVTAANQGAENPSRFFDSVWMVLSWGIQADRRCTILKVASLNLTILPRQ
jgi:hypothetical protein